MPRCRFRCQKGQAAVEWIGLVMLVGLLTLGVAAAVAGSDGRFPGAGVARAVAAKIVCAADIEGACAALGPAGTGNPLIDSYGEEVGRLVARHAPVVLFEGGEYSLPTDFRQCRERACADASQSRVRVLRSAEGVQPTAFTRVVDCRREIARGDVIESCDGAAAGNLYLQYWLYYPDSYTEPWGGAGYHRDDWESYQVRIGSDGRADARASSHNSYNHGAGVRGTLSDLGDRYGVDLSDSAWGPASGYLWVSGGSHAGRVRGGVTGHLLRDRHLRLVPLEPALRDLEEVRFEVIPPWQKAVWTDPESTRT